MYNANKNISTSVYCLWDMLPKKLKDFITTSFSQNHSKKNKWKDVNICQSAFSKIDKSELISVVCQIQT